MAEEIASTAESTETTTLTAPVATIATLGKHEGQSVEIRGWLYNSRESGKLLFPIFRDGTGTVQGVAHCKERSGRSIRDAQEPDAGVVGNCHGQGEGGQARSRRL